MFEVIALATSRPRTMSAEYEITLNFTARLSVEPAGCGAYRLVKPTGSGVVRLGGLTHPFDLISASAGLILGGPFPKLETSRGAGG